MGWYLFYILVYFVILFSIGFYYFKKIKTSDDYLISEWNQDFWPIVGTIISTWCGAAVFIGWVGMGFTVGISGYFQFAFPGLIFCLLFVYFFAEPLRDQKLFTLADFFGERFGREAGIFPSLLSALVYSIPTTALQLVGMSTVFNIAFNIPFTYGIVLGGTLLLLFTVLGGLPATIITDALQSVIIIIGVIVLFFVSASYAGGFSEVLANTPPEYMSILGKSGMQGVLMFALSVGPFYLVWQSTWQRMFAAKDGKTAKKAGLTGFGIAMLISFFPYSVGVIARGFVPLDMRPDLIFSYVTAEVMPPYIGGFVFVALFAALLTGGTSFIMQGSSNLVHDLYYKFFRPEADNKMMMFASRAAVVMVGIFAILVALQVTDIISMYQWALRLTGTTTVFPFLAVMFWKGVTKKACISSMILTAIVVLIWPLSGINLDGALIGFPLSLISLVVISLLTKHSESEQVKRLYTEKMDSAYRN